MNPADLSTFVVLAQNLLLRRDDIIEGSRIRMLYGGIPILDSDMQTIA